MNETANGMVREDKSAKLNFLDYLDPQALKRYGVHMKKGELRHGKANWKKGGYPQLEYLESAMRHLIAAWEYLDENCFEDGEDHLASLWFNVVALMREQNAGKKISSGNSTSI